MRFATVLAVLAFCLPVYAQDASVYHESSNIQMKNMGALGMMGGMMSVSTSGAGVSSGRTNNWRIEFKLKNISTDKVITKVGWQFKMPNSPRPEEVRQYRTKCKIKPQKDATIGESAIIDPSLVPERPVIMLNVTRLEFEDGSFWEQPAPKPEEK